MDAAQLLLQTAVFVGHFCFLGEHYDEWLSSQCMDNNVAGRMQQELAATAAG